MESIDEIQARHRRELKDLQGRITNKKKNATKKTRKGVNDECAAMEQAMREKHQAELAAANGGGADAEGDAEGGEEEEPQTVGTVTTQLADTSIANDTPKDTAQEPTPGKKRNRQKERLARRAAEQEELAAKAADEASHMVDHAAVERATMLPLISKSGRVEHLIRPDGHCLFSAVADQMAGVGKSVKLTSADEELDAFRAVRHTAARYMEAHPDDFAPFLLASEDGTDLDTHIAQIRDTAEWGGQLELSALASAYDVNIRVLHDGRSELITPAGTADEGEGEGSEKRPTLWLVYYRHGFGLGEHYNSLRAKAAA
ncbi:OTU protein [Sporothrix stenoceras]|uniref:OTU protein n=1 Tax=Sporothrix stenoceras TaxID=5173 RepID=A0ABR3ZJP6_9PEZI